MKTEIVIARYNEDLSWLKNIPKTIKITISYLCMQKKSRCIKEFWLLNSAWY